MTPVKEHVQGCLICQKMKCGAPDYCKLPAQLVYVPPWHKVHVDCISPWTIELHSRCLYQFNALTSVDLQERLLKHVLMLLNLVGWLDTLIVCNVFMTKVLNSLGMNSNNFYPKWALSWFLPLHRILRVIVLWKWCTNPWALSFVCLFTYILLKCVWKLKLW